MATTVTPRWRDQRDSYRPAGEVIDTSAYAGAFTSAYTCAYTGSCTGTDVSRPARPSLLADADASNHRAGANSERGVSVGGDAKSLE